MVYMLKNPSPADTKRSLLDNMFALATCPETLRSASSVDWTYVFLKTAASYCETIQSTYNGLIRELSSTSLVLNRRNSTEYERNLWEVNKQQLGSLFLFFKSFKSLTRQPALNETYESETQRLSATLNSVFHAILGTLLRCSDILSQTSQGRFERAVMPNKERRINRLSRSENPTPAIQREYRMCLLFLMNENLSKLLCVFVKLLLDAAQDCSGAYTTVFIQIVENISRVSLTKLGHSLHYATFGSKATDNNEEAIGASRLYSSAEMVPILTEAQFLLPVAKIAYKGLQRCIPRKASSGVREQHVSRIFQNALLNGIFGSDTKPELSAFNDQEEFGTLLDEGKVYRQVEEQEEVKDRNWFVRALWGLCGWDVLTSVVKA